MKIFLLLLFAMTPQELIPTKITQNITLVQEELLAIDSVEMIEIPIFIRLDGKIHETVLLSNQDGYIFQTHPKSYANQNLDFDFENAPFDSSQIADLEQVLAITPFIDSKTGLEIEPVMLATIKQKMLWEIILGRDTIAYDQIDSPLLALEAEIIQHPPEQHIHQLELDLTASMRVDDTDFRRYGPLVLRSSYPHNTLILSESLLLEDDVKNAIDPKKLPIDTPFYIVNASPHFSTHTIGVEASIDKSKILFYTSSNHSLLKLEQEEIKAQSTPTELHFPRQEGRAILQILGPQNRPLSGVIVTLRSNPYTEPFDAISNIAGIIELDNLLVGRYEVSISSPDMQYRDTIDTHYLSIEHGIQHSAKFELFAVSGTLNIQFLPADLKKIAALDLFKIIEGKKQFIQTHPVSPSQNDILVIPDLPYGSYILKQVHNLQYQRKEVSIPFEIEAVDQTIQFEATAETFTVLANTGLQTREKYIYAFTIFVCAFSSLFLLKIQKKRK